MILFIIMKSIIRKLLVFSSILLFAVANLHAFDEGFIWGLRGNFHGYATMPSISGEDLDKMGASYMKGGVGWAWEVEGELGYVFGTKRWFPQAHGSFFSGLGVHAFVGVGSGGAKEIAGNTIEGNTVNMYINIDYMPVITLGGGFRAFFWESKLAAGIFVTTKMIADMSPSYIAYSDNPSIFHTEAGEIIVDDWMMKHMNPFSLSLKMNAEYYQPINNYVRVIIGAFVRFNNYSPGYITMPKSLLDMMHLVRPDFDTRQPLESFFLNSFDFGLTLGLSFRASKIR